MTATKDRVRERAATATVDDLLEKANILTASVVRVGDGRGFVVEHHGKRLILTAAHCLPQDKAGNLIMPPPHPGSFLEERTYKALLGLLGAERTVWTECLFVNPIADVAILGSPDNQDLYHQAEAYEAFVERLKPLPIADATKMGRKRVAVPNFPAFMVDTPGRSSARVLSLAGEWIECTVLRRGTWLTLEDESLAEGGMSGSPIVSTDGRAIGLMSTGGMNPVLRDNLPAWFFRRKPAPALTAML